MMTSIKKLLSGRQDGVPDENFFISSGLQFFGDLVAKSSSGRIEGVFDGQVIECKKLIVGANATIKGNIFAHEILVYGYCEGNLYASGDIKVFDTAVVLGDIYSSSLLVERNATFRGNLKKLKPEDFAEMTLKEKEKIRLERKSNVYNIHSINARLEAEQNKARMVVNGGSTAPTTVEPLAPMKKVETAEAPQEKMPWETPPPPPQSADENNKRWF